VSEEDGRREERVGMERGKGRRRRKGEERGKEGMEGREAVGGQETENRRFKQNCIHSFFHWKYYPHC
jgi:hypothetical protein